MLRQSFHASIATGVITALVLTAQSAFGQTSDQRASTPDMPDRFILAAQAFDDLVRGDAPNWIARDPETQIAIGGFDPVSYFEIDGEDKTFPERGDVRLTARFHDAVFLFSSKAHRDIFLANPERFTPAFGGYDPVLLSQGRYLAADPRRWTIYKGQLYLSRTASLQRALWERQIETLQAAEAQWGPLDAAYQSAFFRAHQPLDAACAIDQRCGEARAILARF
ncbi:MAG: YHS domain-containing (seleno)protein [Pseudomonadota bacterium]